MTTWTWESKINWFKGPRSGKLNQHPLNCAWLESSPSSPQVIRNLRESEVTFGIIWSFPLGNGGENNAELGATVWLFLHHLLSTHKPLVCLFVSFVYFLNFLKFNLKSLGTQLLLSFPIAKSTPNHSTAPTSCADSVSVLGQLEEINK